MEKNRYHSSNVRDLFRKIKSNCIAIIFCLISFHSQAQTNVFSVSDGGFESGTTFAANGWTSVNAANGNRCWYAGTGQAGFSGNRAAFIGNSATTVGTNTASRTVHIYRSVTFPANAGDITLTFKYKQGTLDETFDYTKVYLSSQTPTNGNLVTTGQIGGEYPGTAALATFTAKTILIPDTCAGKTYNLIFTFNADAVTPHAYGAIDDIKLFYTPFTACSGTPNAGTATVTGSACAGNFATPVDLSLTGVSASTGLTYQWEVKPTGAASFTPITGGTTKNLSVIPPALGAKYRCVVTCTASGIGAPSAEVTVTPTSLPTVAPLPFTEGFESWISSCGTNDRPSVNWTSSVVTGDESWRRNNQGSSASWTLASSGAYSPTSTVGSFSARFHSYNATNYGRLDAYVDCSTGASTKQLSFDYINTSGSDILDVFVSTDNGLSFISVTPSLTTAASWTTVVIPFTSSNPITMVRLRALGDFGLSDIGIDNFQIITLTPCSGLPSPGNTLSSLAGACAGSTFSSVLSLQNESTLATTSGLIYQWQSSTDNITYNNIPSANARTLTITSATQNMYYKCLVTCTNSGSTSESTPYLFLVYPAPTLSIATSAPAVCTAGPITMTASGANTYVWSPTTGLSSSTTASTVATVSSDVTYNVTGTSANGCTSVLSKTLLFNPQITADQIVSSATNICGNSNTQLSVLAYSTLNYTMNGTAYNFLTPTGAETVVFSANDDAVSSSITLPFNFKYFGATQTSLFAYTNGFVQFGTSSGSTASYSTVLPTAANPNNIIAGVWDDLNITSGGTVSYFTNGTSPNRVFVIQWQNVKFYNTAANNGNLSFQIQLYEKDNHAEVHIKELNDPVPSAHTVGLENSTGTKAITNSLRNNVSFSVALGFPEAWSFFPDTNNISYAWSPATYLSSTSISNPQVVGINSPVNYTVTITGPAGCSQLTRNLFLNVLPNPAPKITPGDTTICADQTIFLMVHDTGTYAGGYPVGTTVDWIGINNNLSPNDSVPSNLTSNYQAKVILPNGCFGFSNQVTISSRSVVVIPQITHVNCNGVPGKIVVTNVSAPAPPYRYVWTDGTNILRDTISSSISDSLQQLQSGQYFLSIYDNFGGALSCSTLNMMFNVQQQPPLNINLVSKSDITCFGQIDGAIAVDASNGQAPYSYLWSNSSSTSSIFGLSQGTYTVTVTDVTGCNGSASFSISEPQAINGNFVVQNACYGETNGSITANPSGGTGSYYIEWFDSQTNPIISGVNSISGLTADSYYSLIMDANSCQQIDLITVDQLPLINISSLLPSTVYEDSVLSVSGSGFQQVNAITINGVSTSNFTVINDNLIEIIIEANDADGLVEVFSGQCSALSTDSVHITHLFSCYADFDNDLFGNYTDSLRVYSLPLGYVLNNTDCNDANANINPSVAEVCNGIDDNCDTQADEGLIFVTYYVDTDGDGFGSTTSLVSCNNPGAGYVLNNTDCNDNDILVYTSSTLYIDVDGDGYDAGTSVQCYGATLPLGYIASTLGSDCNDNDNTVYTSSTLFTDADGDGYDAGTSVQCYGATLPLGYIATTSGPDCNDANANINPSVAEVCNGIDDNCDTQADEGLIFVTYYVDADGDGFGSTTSLVSCNNPGAGYVLNNTDCNDNDILVYTSSTLFIDADGDGYDAGTSVQCYGATLPLGHIASTLGSDCNDNDNTVYTSSTLFIDADGDGYDAGTSVQCYGVTLPLGFIATTLGPDCNDANANINPSVAEVCNGIDDNCDTQADEGLIYVTYYVDADGDGFGSTSSVVSCFNPGAGYVLNNTDCNDNDILVYTSSTLFIDADGDGYDAGTSTQCYGATLPLGYIASTLGSDCNDNDNTVYTSSTLFIDADGDGYDAGTSVQCYGATLPLGYIATTSGPDCNDANANINPSVAEVCNGIDDNCDTQADEGLIFVTYYVDTDGDGFGSTSSVVSCFNPGAGYVLNNTDCNDNDINVYTSSTLFIDADGDGYDAGTSVQCYGATLPSGYIATTLGSDCNDNDNTVYTSSTLFIDADGDGYDAGASVQCYGATIPAGYSTTSSGPDCNDANSNVNPSVAEVCNGIDDNCDTQADEGLIFVTYYVDTDGDGFGSTSSVVSCFNPGAGYVLNNTDCNDNDILIYTSSTLFIDADGDGYDAGTSVQCYGATLPLGYIASTLGSDCNDNDNTVYTSSTLFIDADGDGYDAGTSVQCYGATLPLGYIATTSGPDCNDANANINPSVAEVCNGIDDNCDTQADEGLIFVTYYVDTDGDGFGSTSSVVSCFNPGAGYVLNNNDCNDNDILVYTSSTLYIDVDGDGYDAGTSVQCYGATLPLGHIASTLGSDCNDANANVHPNATEVCNGIDDDCDTQVDENAFITSIQPSSAAVGATITLTGSGFTGITNILFGVIAANNFTVVDDNTITAEVPVGAVDGFITISNNICGPITSGSIFTVTPSEASLHLKVFIQGFYIGSGQMTPVLYNNGLSTDPNAVDSLTIELHDANSPFSIVEVQTVIVDVNGDALAQFPGYTFGNSYYVVVKHRNSIETWSKDPVLIQSNTLFDLAH